MKQSVDAVDAKLKGHEQLCEERHKTINGRLTRIEGLVVTVVVGMAYQLLNLKGILP